MTFHNIHILDTSTLVISTAIPIFQNPFMKWQMNSIFVFKATLIGLVLKAHVLLETLLKKKGKQLNLLVQFFTKVKIALVWRLKVGQNWTVYHINHYKSVRPLERLFIICQWSTVKRNFWAYFWTGKSVWRHCKCLDVFLLIWLNISVTFSIVCLQHLDLYSSWPVNKFFFKSGLKSLVSVFILFSQLPIHNKLWLYKHKTTTVNMGQSWYFICTCLCNECDIADSRYIHISLANPIFISVS